MKCPHMYNPAFISRVSICSVNFFNIFFLILQINFTGVTFGNLITQADPVRCANKNVNLNFLSLDMCIYYEGEFHRTMLVKLFFFLIHFFIKRLYMLIHIYTFKFYFIAYRQIHL